MPLIGKEMEGNVCNSAKAGNFRFVNKVVEVIFPTVQLVLAREQICFSPHQEKNKNRRNASTIFENNCNDDCN